MGSLRAEWIFAFPVGLADASFYRELVGSLIWFMNSRMDNCFRIGLLDGFMNKWVKAHFTGG